MLNQRLDSLTWLRGAAAFFVIVNHAILSSREQYSAADQVSFLTPFDFMNLGMFAVYLFFALSGCTLTLSHANKVNHFADFIPFYVKRIFRIWPAFALSMLVYLIYIEIFRAFYSLDKDFWIAECLRPYTWQNVLQYLSLTFNITGPRGLFNGPYWTLPVEFQYYLLLPFALLLMKNKITTYVVPLVFGVGLYVLFIKHPFTINRVDIFKMGFSFFGGVVVAKLYLQTRFRVAAWISLLIFIATCIFIGASVNKFIQMPDKIPIINDFANTYGLCAIFIVGVALLTKPIESPGRLLNFFTEYGDISYSIYLFHMLFIGASTLIVIHLGVTSYLAKLLFILSFTVVGSFFLSRITYRYVEQPAISFGSKLAKKLTSARG